MKITLPETVAQRAAAVSNQYNLTSPDNLAAIISAVWILELGGAIRFLHDTSTLDSFNRDLRRRAASPIGTTHRQSTSCSDVLIDNFETYLGRQHPMHPEIDAVMCAGHGGLIALAITGAEAHKAWNEHVQILTKMQNAKPNITGEGVAGLTSYFLLKVPGDLMISALPEQISLWSNGRQDSINLMLHGCFIPLPGSRLAHAAPGQKQYPPAQWGAANSLQPLPIPEVIMTALATGSDDLRKSQSIARSFMTAEDRANSSPNPIRAHSLQEWSSRHDWELILGRFGFEKSAAASECSNPACSLWESRTSGGGYQLTAHDEHCHFSLRAIPTATGPRESFPPEISAYVDQQQRKFEPQAILPLRVTASKFDVVVALAYGGDWLRACRGEHIQWK